MKGLFPQRKVAECALKMLANDLQRFLQNFTGLSLALPL